MGARRGRAPARGALPEARLRRARGRGSAGRPRWGLRARARRGRRVVRGAARRCRTCAPSRWPRSRPSTAPAIPSPGHDRDPDLPLLRCPAGGDLRRPRHVAARELLRAAGARQRDGAVLSAARARLRAAASWSSSRSSSRPSTSSPTTPTSRRTRRPGSSTRERYVDAMTERFGLDGSSQVVEIASNDGYLLQYFVERGIPVLGIEPAANVRRGRRRAAGRADARRVLRRRDRARDRRRSAARTCCSATTCSRTCPTSTTSWAA